MGNTRKIPKQVNWRRRRRVLLVIFLVLACTEGIVMATTSSAVGALPKGAQAEKLERSPNYRDGHFVNTAEAEKPRMFKALGEWMKGGKNTTPEVELPVNELSAASFESPPNSGLRVTWLGHSTSLIEIDGKRLLLDPIWSDRGSPFSWAGPKRFHKPPLPFEELPEIDAVLVSHDHYDHLDMSTVIKLAARGANFIVPLGVGARLRGWNIPEDQIVELDWWESTGVGEIDITATPARHFSGRSLVMANQNKTLWAGFAMNGPEHRVYYSGDSGMFDEFTDIGERLGPFDVAMIEVGAYHRLWADLHLGPEQAALAAQQVDAKLMMPVHWSTFDLAMHSWTEPAERLIVEAERLDLPIAIPRPGQSVEPSAPPALARWWPDIPWQTAQEHPVISSGLAGK